MFGGLNTRERGDGRGSRWGSWGLGFSFFSFPFLFFPFFLFFFFPIISLFFVLLEKKIILAISTQVRPFKLENGRRLRNFEKHSNYIHELLDFFPLRYLCEI